MMIKLENISKYYYSANAVSPALRKIRLEFALGEFVAITGESGSGKSTLLNIISGLDTYDDGELYLKGEATSPFDAADWQEYRKNKIGFVFQNYSLIENYTALYNVESALLIQGYNNKEARQKAKELLKKVGLEGQTKQRASRLSSGQKQRLSIARALAKNTDVIVADEPTGNLDSENGKQIMELFGELSRDKLVIVVTHNYEEAAPYVTRKIRLHDGEVVSDTLVAQEQNHDKRQQETRDIAGATYNHEIETVHPNSMDGTSEVTYDHEIDAAHPDSMGDIAATADNSGINSTTGMLPSSNPKADRMIAWRFTWMNISTQPRRVLLFLVFLLFTAGVTFLFLGDIYSNWDDIFTKKYNDSAFLNSDHTRIVIKKPDGSAITGEDITRLEKVKYVRAADMYGFSNDINYYIEPKKNYEYVYKPMDNLKSTEKAMEVYFYPSNNFMKSSTCIKKVDLSAGRLPQTRNEVVLYSEDESTLGKEILCYFTSKNTWGEDQYYSTMITVVGLLKDKSSQVYFSGELCNMLSLELYGDSYKISLSWNFMKQAYSTSSSFVPVIGEGLKTSQEDKGKEISEARVSNDLVLPDNCSAPGKALIEVFLKNGSGTAPDIELDTMVLSQYNEYSPCFVEIGEDKFYQLFQQKSRQASLYIKDYIYMDKVLKKVTDMGYVAISSYRVSAVEYDNDKVAERSVIIIKAFIVLLIVSVLEIIIIRSIFNLRCRDYNILKSMGMDHKTMKRMNYYEMLIYTAASVIIVVPAANFISLYPIRYLANIVKYYNMVHFTIYASINLAIIVVTVWSFNRYLRRKQKWSKYDTGK